MSEQQKPQTPLTPDMLYKAYTKAELNKERLVLETKNMFNMLYDAYIELQQQLQQVTIERDQLRAEKAHPTPENGKAKTIPVPKAK